MGRGRDTATLRIDNQVREEIIRSCNQPELLREIFERARGLVFGRGTVLEFDAFCRSQPCILWTPSDPNERHITVRVTRELDPVLIHVGRVVWTICNTVPAQGPLLQGHEELLHSCGQNGDPHNGHGVCLNPGHMIRGTEEARNVLRQARRALRQVSFRGEVAVR